MEYRALFCNKSVILRNGHLENEDGYPAPPLLMRSCNSLDHHINCECMQRNFRYYTRFLTRLDGTPFFNDDLSFNHVVGDPPELEKLILSVVPISRYPPVRHVIYDGNVIDLANTPNIIAHAMRRYNNIAM